MSPPPAIREETFGYDQNKVTSHWERNRPDRGQDCPFDDFHIALPRWGVAGGRPHKVARAARSGLGVLPDRRTAGPSRMCVSLVGASDEAARDEEEGSGCMPLRSYGAHHRAPLASHINDCDFMSSSFGGVWSVVSHVSGRYMLAQCAKQPACLGQNTERSVHRTGPALFMPWSDAPGLSAHTLIVRSIGQENGSPQWGVRQQHTKRHS